jgi:Xaa-Pro aminopeptidase
MLTVEGSRRRLDRLADHLAEQRIDLAVFCSRKHVYYYTGVLGSRLYAMAALVGADGRSWAVLPNEPDQTSVDTVVTYTGDNIGTLRLDQRTLIADAVKQIAQQHYPTADRVGLEGTQAYPQLIDAVPATAVDLDPYVWIQRKRKDPDELTLIRKAIDISMDMYAHAKKIIEPGVNELWVYGELYKCALESGAEIVEEMGNDYQCGTPGGPPRDRRAEPGELYIFDLGPTYRGYHADNCRTFTVDGRPTDIQLEVATRITGALQYVEKTVKPGVRAKELYTQVRQMLDEHYPGNFWHHLGHGIGLFPHEAPQLNPAYDAVFEVGDVFTAEPGIYFEDLRAGIRLEENFLVTDTGVEKLTPFPLDLA